MVICLERGADLHIAQLMPLPLTVSSFSKIQIGFTFLVPTHPGIPGKRAVKRMCVCVRGWGHNDAGALLCMSQRRRLSVCVYRDCSQLHTAKCIVHNGHTRTRLYTPV